MCFNCVTDYRLRELTDHDAPLMREMKDRAMGTFNHSIVVAHLAEACAIALNEDTALARAVAYYHDVGKLRQPEYFTENQVGFNPHSELSPELSVDIIRSHAKDGYELIRSSICRRSSRTWRCSITAPCPSNISMRARSK